VVSEPLLNKAGRVRYIVCGSSGRIGLSASKTDVHAKELGFFKLKRGDVIQIENPQIRESGYGIAEETTIVVIKQH
ncbi:MAG TPA: methyltransferase type 12, partial [Spirochaetia bacterium]|nr:methyltransferase type 12 [Spirochaetia bacterium]